MSVQFDALILAGGSGERLGGASKADLRLRGRRLLDLSLDAVSAARHRVVVGDLVVPAGVLVTREEPPGGGPAAGAQAGLATLATQPASSPFTAVLAVDQPGVEQAIADLLAAVQPDEEVDAWGVVDDRGQCSWLLAIYRTERLRQALAGNQHGASMRRAVEPLRWRPVTSSADLTDVDTPADVAHWGILP